MVSNFNMEDVHKDYLLFQTYSCGSMGLFLYIHMSFRSDAVINSLASVLFLDKNHIHFWEEVGYKVNDVFQHCPSELQTWKKCTCRPDNNFDWHSYSCLKTFLEA